MDSTTRDLVRQRASDQCEYCRIPQEATPYFTFHVEHIVPRQHGGSDALDNLALACNRCNAYKGPNLTAIDSDSRKIVELFHPRQDVWKDHFMARDGEIVGLTPRGRATVQLLNMNALHRVELREDRLEEGPNLS